MIVWTVSGNESPGGINWEAYSHEELHGMLWQDADVGDVSTVADEWTRHRAALDAHGEVLREQRTALLEGWSGAAAEEAAARIAALAERVGKISELAAAGQRAAQDSADALAAARAAMPAPPDTTTQAFAGFPVSFGPPVSPASYVPTSVASYIPSFTVPSAPTMPAGATSGFYFYFGATSADQQKAQAVRAMQTYESSLNGSGRLIDTARAGVPQAAATPAAGPAAAVRTPGSGGVPWQRLVGGGAATARVPASGGAAPAAAPQQQQTTPGVRAGVMAGQPVGATATGGLAGDSRTSAQNNGMAAPPAAGGRKDEDQRHENQMPTLDHDLFAVTGQVAPAVIGEDA